MATGHETTPAKELVAFDPQSRTTTVLARFYLEGDVVRIEYLIDLEHDTLPEQLQCVIGPPPDFRQLRPDDGRVYWDSLEREFANSTYCSVRTVVDDA